MLDHTILLLLLQQQHSRLMLCTVQYQNTTHSIQFNT